MEKQIKSVVFFLRRNIREWIGNMLFAILNHFGFNTGTRPTIYSHQERHHEIHLPLYNRRIFIRFGDTRTIPLKGIEFNTCKAIRLCIDKYRMKVMFQRNGVSSPMFFDKAPKSDMHYPIVMKRYEHSQGRGMKLIKNKADVPNDTNQCYFESFVNCDTEYRCHVMGEKIFHADIKTLREDATHSWIKNIKHYAYVKTDIDSFSDTLKENVIKAVKCLGLTFGAVDIAVNSKTGRVFVYEVNSAAGMRVELRRNYQNALIDYIETHFMVRRV